jgi:tRNA dimethylallyltransferase
MTTRPPVFLLSGPTASGKSALALRLAEMWGGEIVNADAIQLYADLRVLSARPDEAEEARAPHHLFGVVDAADGWSVGRWLGAATAAIRAINDRGRTAIVVGGTGLYFRALTNGLAEAPPISPEQRAEAATLYEHLGEAEFRVRLARVDPRAEARIFPGDRQRLVRAWEVFAASGRSLSDWQAQTSPTLAPGSWAAAALEPSREALYDRCDRRLGAMVQAGALAETKSLMARGLDPSLPAMKAVGLRELAAHLAGELTLEKAMDLARQETRRYAKRQMTWLRNQCPDWPRVRADDAEGQWRELEASLPVPSDREVL